MKKWLAIAVYRCEVGGRSSSSLDVQVRYYRARTRAEVIRRLKAEARTRYRNERGQAVTWRLSQIMCVGELQDLHNGSELIGFITTIDELRECT